MSLAGGIPGGDQSASTVFNLRVLSWAYPALIAALIIGAYYPITEKAAREVRAILDERKNDCTPQPASKD